MADNVLTLTTGDQLKRRFRAALNLSTEPSSPVETPIGKVTEVATSNGHGLYILYRRERAQQGWAEFEWAKLTESQQLVWARMALTLTGKE